MTRWFREGVTSGSGLNVTTTGHPEVAKIEAERK